MPDRRNYGCVLLAAGAALGAFVLGCGAGSGLTWLLMRPKESEGVGGLFSSPSEKEKERLLDEVSNHRWWQKKPSPERAGRLVDTITKMKAHDLVVTDERG